MQRFGMFRAEAAADLEVIDDASSSSVAITGTQDGVNADFTVDALPAVLVRNGLRQSTPGDYSITGNTLTWVVPPTADDIIFGLTAEV
jgi:hypothetical protein